MPSAKGKPTDQKLKEKVTEEVKQQPNKDGSGKGQMAAWKAAKIGKEYEAQGGDYENEAGSKDKPVKGPPQKKSDAEKTAETSGSSPAKKDDKEGEEKGGEAKKRGRPAKAGGVKKEKKEPREGERKSARVKAGPEKRKVVDDEEDEEEEEEEKPKKKKGKAAGKAK